MEYILLGGYTIDANNNKVYQNFHIKKGKIHKILKKDEQCDMSLNFIDVKDKLIVPGLVDVHVHFRTPGFEYKEDFYTGSMAAKKGGYTQVFAMPNTNPVIDNIDVLKEVERKCENMNIKISHYSAITNKLNSEELVDMEMMSNFCPGFTNDGLGVQRAGVMYEAMLKASKLKKPIVAHCEDETLLYGGVVHEGINNQKLKLPGILSISESIQLQRDISLSQETGCKFHGCHISTWQSVEALKIAKDNNLKVSAEVTPHHLLLTESDVIDSNFKMNPPLRSKKDKEALIWAIQNGVIEVIATDHAPHSLEEKSQDISKAPFGIIGLEHAFSLCYTYLVQKNIISLYKLIELMSYNPRKIFNLETGLKEGDSADITIIDLEDSEDILESNIVSKSKNTPFIGKKTNGLINKTIVNGKVVYERK